MRAGWWLAVGGLLHGCGAKCERVESEAIDRVQEALAYPTRCMNDSDCVEVALAGSCFDACSVAAHEDDAREVERVITEVEAEVCVDYGGCELVVPPCVPLGPPLCLNERCTSGAAAD